MIALFLFGESVSSRVRDCDYDKFHKQGGQNPACGYTSVPVASVTIAGSSAPAFKVDGGHLTSDGPVKYMKQKKSMSTTDFLTCKTPPCQELDVKVTR